MTTPVNPSQPPFHPQNPAAYNAFVSHLKVALAKLLSGDNGDDLQQILLKLMNEGIGIPAWANSASGRQFAASLLQSHNIDQDFLIQVMTEWISQQGISTNGPDQKNS